jgi:hypothetical protein
LNYFKVKNSVIPSLLSSFPLRIIKRLRDKALIEENGCSGEYAPAFSKMLYPCSDLVEINNAAYKPFKLALRALLYAH